MCSVGTSVKKLEAVSPDSPQMEIDRLLTDSVGSILELEKLPAA